MTFLIPSLRLLALAVTAWVLLIVVVWLAQRRLIYLPMGDDVPLASTVLAGAEDVTLRTGDGLELGA